MLRTREDVNGITCEDDDVGGVGGIERAVCYIERAVCYEQGRLLLLLLLLTCEDDDVGGSIEAIHLHQQLIQSALTLVVTTPEAT